MPAAGKDYKGRSTMSNKQALPGYLWLLAGLAIGLFIAFLVYLDKQPKEKISFTEAVTQELDKVKNQRNKASVHPASTNKKEPEFSFYTILPELEVLISDAEISLDKKAIKTNSAASNTTAAQIQYVLQAGSFRNYNDANTLKASLAFLGVESSIQSVNIKNESWHRVRIGPFRDTKNLHGTRDTLQKNNIKTMTVVLK
jgi:cell division protein FtsN